MKIKDNLKLLLKTEIQNSIQVLLTVSNAENN